MAEPPNHSLDSPPRCPAGLPDYRKGDGYLDVHSSVLASTPWAPGWGNHEFLGEHGDRLLNVTAGMVAALRSAPRAEGVPPPTAQFYSIDVGLLHVVQIDLSVRPQ